ncbi:cation/acetate symporter ActP [Porticoccus sp. GXU_MW_L64]
MRIRILLCSVLLAITPTLPADTIQGAVDKQPLNITAIALFFTFVLGTLGITKWASSRSRSRQDFYTAGGGIPAWQNGVAISGDFLSAATLLGFTGALYGFGFDALLLAIGVVCTWPIILFLISERLRNLGRFTFVDVLTYRLSSTGVRVISALGSLSVVVFYLIAQVVGAGKLVQLLFGLDYIYAVISVNVLMIIYVSIGGMLATTWVQFIKAVLLVTGGTIMVLLLLAAFDFSIDRILQSATETHHLGAKLLSPGNWITDPMAVISLALTSLFGFIGLPHILMRMFTVKDAGDARKSSFYAIGIMCYFYLLIILFGFGAIYLLLNSPEYFDSAGNLIGGQNMVALHVTHILGGDLLLGFMSAVAFATILAVVAGLALAGAATVSHDLYSSVIKKGRSNVEVELKITKVAVWVLGLTSILLAIAFEHQNVIFIATLSLAVAGSVNAPLLIAVMYWRGLTSRGAVWGGAIGLASSIVLIILGPNVWTAVLGNEQAIFPYQYPTVVSMPLAFIAIWFFSVTDKSAQAQTERDAYTEQLVRSETGIGIAEASNH